MGALLGACAGQSDPDLVPSETDATSAGLGEDELVASFVSQVAGNSRQVEVFPNGGPAGLGCGEKPNLQFNCFDDTRFFSNASTIKVWFHATFASASAITTTHTMKLASDTGSNLPSYELDYCLAPAA